MRLFRTEEAARKAGFVYFDTSGRCENFEGDRGVVLTDRERALLGALEKMLPAAIDNATFVWCEYPDSNAKQDIADAEAAKAFIASLNVEG